jgi:CubicO group peptidase (beta-lactamase class C family)
MARRLCRSRNAERLIMKDSACSRFPVARVARSGRAVKALLLAALVPSLAGAEPLPRSTPEAQGVPTAGIRSFVEAVNAKVGTMHSFMLVRHGHVIAEGWWKPQTPDTPHVLHSLSKSFTSTAVGLAIGEGRLSLDDRVLSYFPEEAPPEPSENLRAMRVRDLLTMSTGHESEPKFTSETPWVRSFLAHPVPRPPGTHFVYNSPATYMVSALVQKVTGQKLVDYLRPRLFEPLGIENPQWNESPQGISVGGWGLHLRTEDIARFGQLSLQRGVWNGKQLLPASWVDQATARQVANGSDPASDWTQGYGYQFWRCRHGAYRGDGAFGQFCVVMPEWDAVLAMTADTRDMAGQLRLVWEYLLPSFRPESLPANEADLAGLRELAASLSVPDGHVPNVLRPPGSADR